jgi:hypothetical protein
VWCRRPLWCSGLPEFAKDFIVPCPSPLLNAGCLHGCACVDDEAPAASKGAGEGAEATPPEPAVAALLQQLTSERDGH